MSTEIRPARDAEMGDFIEVASRSLILPPDTIEAGTNAIRTVPLDELLEKYGDISRAERFVHKNRFKPSITFKPKTFGTTIT